MEKIAKDQMPSFLMAGNSFSFDWDSADVGRSRSRPKSSLDGFEIRSANYRDSEETRIYISTKIMKMFNLKIGQRVLLQMDDSGRYLGIRVVKYGGLRLSSAESDRRDRELAEGKSSKCRVKFKKRFDHPSGWVDPDCCFILPSDPDVVIVDLQGIQ